MYHSEDGVTKGNSLRFKPPEKIKKVQFKGTTDDGITYVVWTYDCSKIQNP